MSGGGIGIDYSVYRPSGSYLKRTGGIASGSIPAMKLINECGRQVMQGGSRRSAMYASLHWEVGNADKSIQQFMQKIMIFNYLIKFFQELKRIKK